MQERHLEQTGDDTAVVRNLLIRTRDPDAWAEYLDVWLDRFAAYDLLGVLGHGLAHSIPTATSDWIPLETAKAWNDLWHQRARKVKQLQIPLRLLDAAVRYRETLDLRVLLGLPREEREIVKPLLRDTAGAEFLPKVPPELVRLIQETERELDDEGRAGGPPSC